MSIYSAPDYSMGKHEALPVTAAEKSRAEVELAKMRRSLRGWLKYRNLNNAVVAGRAKAKVPPGLAKKMIESGRDWGLEQRLGKQLYVLLSEVFDAQQLPDPRDPDAAVKLAEIAIAGRLPMESTTPGPEAQGLIWLWPAVVVVGLVLFTVVFKIRSDASLAEEKEKIECVKMGACTDYGFWLKLGGVALIGWLAWDKFGLRELATRSRSKAGG
jgi:hypothetical protein